MQEVKDKLKFSEAVRGEKTCAAVDFVGRAMSSTEVTIIEAIVAYMLLIVQSIKKDEDIELMVDLLRLIHSTNKAIDENDESLL